MAVEKRLKKIWNGVAWVEVYHPTSDDLIYVQGGSKTLRTKLGELDTEIDEHVTDTDLHASPGDKSKLANLAADANATYATKTELTTHEDDDVRHITTTLQTKLNNLHNDANATYATKAELAGKTEVKFYTTFANMNSADASSFPTGTTCWVADASGDTTNVKPPGSAKYMWDGTDWQFLFEADANVEVEWEDIIGRPEIDSVEDIEEAIAKMHSHTNATVLNGLAVDGDGDLTLNSVKVGEKYNRVYLTSTAPATPNAGDIWMAEID